MCLVTLTIASYNNANNIERCIESAQMQTYQNLEIIVVDDGSTDDTIVRIRKYRSDARISIITKLNGGLSSVRQMALENAKGEYVCFIDADDYLTDSYVERMLKKMQEDNSDICVCGTKFEDEEGKYIASWSDVFSCKDSISPYHVSNSEMAIIDNPNIGNLHISDSWNKLYRMSFLKKSNVLFSIPRGLNGSDLLFNKLLILHNPVYSSISNVCYVHVVYKKSAVHRRNKQLIKSFMYITTQLIKETETLNSYTSLRQSISNFYIKSLYASCCDVFQDSLSIEEAKCGFSQLYDSNKLYLNESPQLKLKYSDCKSVKLGLFLLLMKNSPKLLLYFFQIRKQIRNNC